MRIIKGFPSIHFLNQMIGNLISTYTSDYSTGDITIQGVLVKETLSQRKTAALGFACRNRSIPVLSLLLLLLLLTIFFKWGFERLYERKRYELDKIERLDKPRKSYLSASFRSITTKPIPATAGFVKGIVYSNTKSSAVISDAFIL